MMGAVVIMTMNLARFIKWINEQDRKYLKWKTSGAFGNYINQGKMETLATQMTLNIGTLAKLLSKVTLII